MTDAPARRVGGPVAAWAKAASACEDAQRRFLADLAGRCARAPRLTISLVVLILLGLGAGLLTIKVESKGDRLWVPQDSIPKLNEAYVSATFEPTARFERVYGIAAPGGDGNVLKAKHIRRLFAIHDEVRALKTASGVGFEDVCLRTPLGECFNDGILRFWRADSAVFAAAIPTDDAAGDAALLEAVSATNFPDGAPVVRHSVFGNTLVEDKDGNVVSSEAVAELYLLRGLYEGSDDELKAWEELMIEAVAEREQTGVVTVIQSFRSLDDELGRTVGNDVPLFAGTFVVMITFCCLTLGKFGDMVKSRVALAQAATGLVFLSMLGAYGTAMLFGVPFTTLTQILPFLLLGIGLDDIFVIFRAYELTDEALPADVRLQQALYRVGSSISLTTATNMVAFALGAWSDLPAVSWFCIYASLGVGFDYATQVTAFVAMIALDEQRVKSGRTDVFCCHKRKKGTTPSTGDVESAAVPSDAVDAPATDVRPSALTKFLGSTYGPFLMLTPVKVCVILLFTAMVGVFAWQASEVGNEFKLVSLTPDNSYLREYFNEEERLFGSDTASVNFDVYTKSVEYHKEAVQRAIEADTVRFLQSPYVIEPASSWLRELRAYAAGLPVLPDGLTEDGYFADADEFEGSPMHDALCAFLDQPVHMIHRGNVMFSKSGVRLPVGDDACRDADAIVASRVSFVHSPLDDTQTRVDAMLDGQARAAQSTLDPKPFAHTFRYVFFEQFRIVIPALVQNFIVCVVAVLVLCAITLIYPSAVLLVAIVIVVIDVDLVGAMHAMGLTINAVTFIQLVMAIGVLVDWSAHMVHSFLLQPTTLTRDQRVIGALSEMGPSVFLGAASTFLGVAPLALSNSEIFRVFFKCFGAIVIFGIVHGFVLVPVLLSYIGPTVQLEEHAAPAHLKFHAPSLRHLDVGASRAVRNGSARSAGDVELGGISKPAAGDTSEGSGSKTADGEFDVGGGSGEVTAVVPPTPGPSLDRG